MNTEQDQTASFASLLQSAISERGKVRVSARGRSVFLFLRGALRQRIIS
jgi:hypothetical protein